MDPEFDTSPVSTVRLASPDPFEHQRMVVNPFLMACALVVGVRVVFWMISSNATPLYFLFGSFATILIPRLVQYHCLDCGRSGLYSKRSNHVCQAILSRRQRDQEPKSLIPSARSQLIFWIYVLASISVVLAVSLLAPSD